MQKLLLLVVGLFVVWQVLLSDAVSNTLLDFFLGGQVPGTDVILSPEVVLWGVLGLFVLIAGIIAIRSWSAHRRVRRAAAAMNQAETSPITDSLAMVEPSAVVVSDVAKEPKKLRAKKPKTTSATASKIWASLLVYARQGRERAQPVLSKTAHILRVIWQSIVVHVIGGYELARMGTIRLAQATRRAAIRFWYWLLPYLRRLDTADETGWVQMSAWIASHVRRNDFVQGVSELKKATKLVVPKTQSVEKAATTKRRAKKQPTAKRKKKTTQPKKAQKP